MQAVLLHRQVGDAVAVLLEPLAGVEDRLVLGDARDDVVALLAVHLGDALDREVVRLGRAAGEDDLLRVRADQIGDLLARLLDRLFGFPAERMVAAGGVAEVLGEVRQHRLDDARIDRRRRVIVHVDRKLDGHCCLSRSAGLTARLCAMSSRRPSQMRVQAPPRASDAGAGGSAASSAIVHSPSAARIRSRTRHSGSRTLHFANCSHCLSSVEQAVTVTGPSIAWMTSATEICDGARAS